MTEKKLKGIIKNLSGINKEDWESLKSYIDYKMYTTGTIKDNKLTFVTLKTFFIKTEN